MPPGPHAGNRNRPAYSGQPRFRFPKQIVQLFTPRKPLEFKPPPRKRNLPPMTGIASFASKFEATTKTSSTAEATANESSQQIKFETPAQRRRRVRQEKHRKIVEQITKQRAQWDPQEKNENVQKTKDAYNTIFISNVSKSMIELTLQEEFEQYGPIRKVVMPKNQDGVPCGYAFVEYEHERDARDAVRQADGMRFGGRRLKVDVERGRTVKGWWPNRLDGPYNRAVHKPPTK